MKEVKSGGDLTNIQLFCQLNFKVAGRSWAPMSKAASRGTVG
jgi:hypothetical protein